jgi:hypothetical protein
MSEASKAAALAHAAMVHQGSGDCMATLETAEAFHAFIGGATVDKETNTVTPAKKATPAKAVEKTAPAKKKVAAPVEEPEEETEEPAEGEASKEQVAEAIEGLLNANLRPQVIKLFAKYKAKSLSGVAPEDYAAMLQDAQDLILSA